MALASILGRIARQTLDGCTFTARRGLIKGMRVQGGAVFLPEGMWPRWQDTAESRLLANLDLRGKVVYDVGALHGHLTMFFARQAAQVVTYEPNPAGVRRIERNLRLNGITNTRVRAVAVGDRPGSIELALDPTREAQASGEPAEAAQQLARGGSALQVPMVRLDDDIAMEDLPRPDLVKIDVEGMEVAVLSGMARTLRQDRPQVQVEIHGVDVAQQIAHARRVLELLVAAGYGSILHVESGRAVGVADAETAREGHLFATAESGGAPGSP